MTVLLWLAMGTLDFGRVFYTYVGLNNAAREGAHMAASVQITCDGSTLPSQVRDTVLAAAPIYDVSMKRDPSSSDSKYALGTTWLNMTTKNLFELTNVVQLSNGTYVATWTQFNGIKCAPSSASPDRRTVTITGYPIQTISPLFIGKFLGDSSGIVRVSASATMPVVNQ
jgi:Flp pilus assembly protein TadG